MPINVLIADKKKLIRDVLKYRLESDEEIRVVGETDNGYECLNITNKCNPNIIISDTDLNSLNGLKVLEIMKDQSLRNKFLFMSGEFNKKIYERAIELGCDGFITKDADFFELKKAIYSVYNGERYIQTDLKEFYINETSKRNVSDEDSLTKREIDILKLIAHGLSNKDISEQYNISDRTVKNHVCSIFKKLHVNDRTQAAVYAIRKGIVEL